MTRVSVRAMTHREFDQWQDDLAAAYAQEQVAAGRWPADDAVARARVTTGEFLPEGDQTPRMLFLQGILSDTGQVMGRAWLSLEHHQRVAGAAFLYDIEVLPALRGLGLGGDLLAAVESAARAAGANSVELNVFGRNEIALRLYSSAGYSVASQQMRKEL